MILYEEQQKFNQLWLWALLIAVAAVTVLPALSGAGHTPPAYFAFATLAAVAILFAVLTLTTTVKRDRIIVRFHPFSGRTIYKKDIVRAYVRRYHPLTEYGGWGYRIGPNGMAYNTMGSDGLQLVLRNGDRVLIGTQRPEEMKRVIEAWLS